jgi:hypothetical protein
MTVSNRRFSDVSIQPFSGLTFDLFSMLCDVLRRLPTQLSNRLDELLPDIGIADYPHARRKRAA